MGISYLKNRTWANWTRDERFFCSVLFAYARQDPRAFAKHLITQSRRPLDLSPEGDWDLGYEVCFYRDYLWSSSETARQKNYPVKRTFDLCLFGEQAVIIIEAKVFEQFKAAQINDIKKDRNLIKDLLKDVSGLESLKVFTVALASSKYFLNAKSYAKPESLTMFDDAFNSVITWSEVAALYDDKLLLRADDLYKMGKKNLLEGPSL